jgi:glc operon protein GlcG
MKKKAVLEFADVQKILSAAIASATGHAWAVSIAVVDDGGHLLGLQRLDDAAPISAYIATEKARSSALGRRDSSSYEKMINEGRTAFLSAPVLQGLLEGGMPIVIDGQVAGAIGVSGVKSTEDVQVAKAGVEALGQG